MSRFQKLQLEIKEKNLKLETSINSQKNKGRHDFIIKSEIFVNDKEILDVDQLDREKFEGIVSDYQKKINSIERQEEIINSDKSRLSPIEYIKKDFSGLKIALDTLNVITVNQREQPIVRTSVELDADIITVLKKEFKAKKNSDLVLAIHGANVLLVNKFFKMYFVKITKQIRKITRIVKLTSGTIFGSVLPIIEGISHSELNFSLEFGLVFTPILAFLGYKYGAKIIKPLLKHLVKKFVL